MADCRVDRAKENEAYTGDGVDTHSTTPNGTFPCAPPPPPEQPPSYQNSPTPLPQSTGHDVHYVAPNSPTVPGSFPGQVNRTNVNVNGGDCRLRVGQKSVAEAYLLAMSPFGILGFHHIYLERYYWALLYTMTFGLLGCGYVIDWFRVPCLVKEANAKKVNFGRNPHGEKSVSDAYTLWFPFGLLGFHHYYLRNYWRGLLYTCTIGLFGIGWIVDAFLIPRLVKGANERSENYAGHETEISGCVAIGLAVSPLGLCFGAHHIYLRRPGWSVLYTFTMGLLGMGWVADWFRMPLLVRRANDVIKGLRPPNTKTADDAYVLWFLFGFLGFHQFYLSRPVWGTLYILTFGVLGIGWLVDLFRIPTLVREANQRIHITQHKLLEEGQNTGYTTEYSENVGFNDTAGQPTYGVLNQSLPNMTADQFSPYANLQPTAPSYNMGRYGVVNTGPGSASMPGGHYHAPYSYLPPPMMGAPLPPPYEPPQDSDGTQVNEKPASQEH